MSDYFLADDLSGALDAAAAFHRSGRRVTVMLSAEEWSPPAPGEIIGLTTETRNCSPAEAGALVTAVMAGAGRHGCRLVYKKIDSTMRGPVAAEVSALAAALPGVRILFAPANPAVGRTVRAGELRVRGVPLADTEFAHDPLSPVRDSSIRRLLGLAAGERVVIPDIETEADLVAAVAQMEAGGKPWVAIGSGALARPVAARLASTRSPQPTERDDVPIPASPVLLLCGSAHHLNRGQAAALGRERSLAVHELRRDAIAGAVASAVSSLQCSPGTALMIAEERGESSEVLRTLTTAATQIIQQAGVRRVFVTGGETAFALCAALKIPALAFTREVESGLSLSRGVNESGPFLLAVKPGGFGDGETWVRAFDALIAPRTG